MNVELFVSRPMKRSDAEENGDKLNLNAIGKLRHTHIERCEWRQTIFAATSITVKSVTIIKYRMCEC